MVKRYELYYSDMDEDDLGTYVLHSDCAALERRLKTLRELCGYVENGTDAAIVIGQDDATKTWHVYYATQHYKTIAWGNTFNEMLDNAAKYLETLNDG